MPQIFAAIDGEAFQRLVNGEPAEVPGTQDGRPVVVSLLLADIGFQRMFDMFREALLAKGKETLGVSIVGGAPDG